MPANQARFSAGSRGCRAGRGDVGQGGARRCGDEFNPRIAKFVQQLTRNVDREQYKKRIQNTDYAVQIIKLADTVDNCSNLAAPYLPEDLVRRKIEDCKSFYLDMAKKICPKFYSMLLESLKSWLI